MADVEEVVVRGEGLTLSTLTWRRWRRPHPGYVERVLDLNQDLARNGPILPVGTTVLLPTDPPGDILPEEAVALWD